MKEKRVRGKEGRGKRGWGGRVEKKEARRKSGKECGEEGG